MREHKRLREVGRRPPKLPQFVPEAEVDVHLHVLRAVERSGRRLCLAATRVRLSSVEHNVRLAVRDTLRRQRLAARTSAHPRSQTRSVGHRGPRPASEAAAALAAPAAWSAPPVLKNAPRKLCPVSTLITSSTRKPTIPSPPPPKPKPPPPPLLSLRSSISLLKPPGCHSISVPFDQRTEPTHLVVL